LSIERTAPFNSAPASSLAASSGPAFGPALGGTLAGGTLGGGLLPASPAVANVSPLFALTSSLSLLPSSAAGDSHDHHSPALSTLLADPHGYHAAGSGGVTGLVAATTFTAFSASSAADESAWSPAGAASDKYDAGGHHGRSASGASGDVVAKFAPKRCTVRLTSKEVFRNVAGEKKCDCAQKKAAAEAAKHAAESEQAGNSTSKTAATTPVACPRCQMAALSPELAADMALAGEVCDLPLNDEVVVATADTQPTPSAHDEAITSGEWSFLPLPPPARSCCPPHGAADCQSANSAWSAWRTEQCFATLCLALEVNVEPHVGPAWQREPQTILQ
jgi:hypothetical protein